MQSAGEVTTRLLAGSVIGRSPVLSSRAKNWLKLSHPLGALGRPPTSDSPTVNWGEFAVNESRMSWLKDSEVSRKAPHSRA